MNRYIVQYHSRTLAALAGRERQQKFPSPKWTFDYPELPSYEMKIALSDHVKKTGNINLHTGLRITADVKADSEEEARGISKNIVETLLNLISFSTLTFCGPTRLVSIISTSDAGTKAYPFRHYVYPFDEEEILGSLSVISEPTFRTIFEAYEKSPNKSRTLRALSWLRKGISEDGSVDEFICYWVGIEAIKHLLVPEKKAHCIVLTAIKHIFISRKVKRKKRSVGEEWGEVEEIFQNRLHRKDFKKIKQAGRNGLLHGFRELDNKFLQEIGSYVEPIRKTLVYCMGSVLGLENKILSTLANKTPRRIRQNPWSIVEGALTNVKLDFDELLKNYPFLDIEKMDKRFLISKKGKLTLTFSVTHRFHGPKGAKWEVKATELWGDKDAGIEQVEIKG